MNLDDESEDAGDDEGGNIIEKLQEPEVEVRSVTPEESGSNASVDFRSASEYIPSMKKGTRLEYYDLDGDENACQILSRAGKVGGRHQHCYNVRDQHGNIKWVDLS